MIVLPGKLFVSKISKDPGNYCSLVPLCDDQKPAVGAASILTGKIWKNE